MHSRMPPPPPPTHTRACAPRVTGKCAALRSALKSRYCSPVVKQKVLTEFGSWLSIPQNLVDVYLNFDNEAPLPNLRVVATFCQQLCAFGRAELDESVR